MIPWKSFWQSYRMIDIRSDDDLLFQVALTVNGKAISKEIFDTIIQSIKKGLDLNSSDILLDLCCGNGIITYELSKLVSKVIGIDFSVPYIENARKFKSSDNITYILHDVTELGSLELPKATKILLYGSLAYLNADQVDKIFQALNKIGNKWVIIYFGSILDKSNIWNFFNTTKRKIVYLLFYRMLGRDPGVGKWWSKSEISSLAMKHGFECNFIPQNLILHTAHYRFDVIISRKGIN